MKSTKNNRASRQFCVLIITKGGLLQFGGSPQMKELYNLFFPRHFGKEIMPQEWTKGNMKGDQLERGYYLGIVLLPWAYEVFSNILLEILVQH